jgi:hypothetical protein
MDKIKVSSLIKNENLQIKALYFLAFLVVSELFIFVGIIVLMKKDETKFLAQMNARVYERNPFTGMVYVLDERINNPESREIEFRAQGLNFISLLFENSAENIDIRRKLLEMISSKSVKEAVASYVYDDRISLIDRVRLRGVRSYVEVNSDKITKRDNGYQAEVQFVVLFVDGTTFKRIYFEAELHMVSDVARSRVNPNAVLITFFKIDETKTKEITN